MSRYKRFRDFLEERPDLTMIELTWAIWWRIFVATSILWLILFIISG